MQFSIGIYNKRDVMIDNAHVAFGNFTSAGGSMVSGGLAVHRNISPPVPEQVVLSYDLPDGTHITKAMDLRPKIAADFEGFIFFEINQDDTVDIDPVTYAERKAGKGPHGKVK
jgi:hypothetical protein